MEVDFFCEYASLSKSKKYAEARREVSHLGNYEQNTVCEAGFDNGLSSHCTWFVLEPDEQVVCFVAFFVEQDRHP